MKPTLVRCAALTLLTLIFSAPGWGDDNPGPAATAPDPGQATTAEEPNRSVRSVLVYALSQLGASYRYGGGNTQGFDCSGFVKHVFSHAADFVLPHSSRAMSQYGERVPQGDMQPGDLVFFETHGHHISHVGIYIGNQKFIHASSTKTGVVMISDLRERYWARHYASARHLQLGEAPPADILSAQQSSP